MKYLLLSVATLSLLFALSLWNAAAINAQVEDWCRAAETARAEAQRGDMSAAAAHMDTLRKEWDARRTYYHSVLEHDELDNAEELLARADAALESGDADGFSAEAAALTVQLRVLAEMQGLRVENVL